MNHILMHFSWQDDEVRKQTCGLFLMLNEESSSVEGRRARELSKYSWRSDESPSYFVKVAAGRNDQNLRNDEGEELVKPNRAVG